MGVRRLSYATDRRHDQRIHAGPRVEAVLLAETGVDYIADVVDGQRRLRHVRRQNHLAYVVGSLLEALRQTTREGTPAAAPSAEGTSRAGARAAP